MDEIEIKKDLENYKIELEHLRELSQKSVNYFEFLETFNNFVAKIESTN